MSHEVPQSSEDEEAEGASEKRVLATLAAIISRFLLRRGCNRFVDILRICFLVVVSSSSVVLRFL